jgi:hypothetical protein
MLNWLEQYQDKFDLAPSGTDQISALPFFCLCLHNLDKPQPNKKNKSARNTKIFLQDDCGKIIEKPLNHLATIILYKKG